MGSSSQPSGARPLNWLPVGLAAGTISSANSAFIPLRLQQGPLEVYPCPLRPSAKDRGIKARGRRSLPVRWLIVHLPPSLPVAFQFESKKEYSLFIDYFK